MLVTDGANIIHHNGDHSVAESSSNTPIDKTGYPPGSDEDSRAFKVPAKTTMLRNAE